MRSLLAALFVSVLAFAFIGCDEKSQQQANLTPEQKSYVDQASKQFDQLKANVQKLVDDTRKAAESNPEIQKAVAGVQDSFANVKTSLEGLRTAAGTAFEQKKVELEAAIKDFTGKYTDALAKSKLGGMKLPF